MASTINLLLFGLGAVFLGVISVSAYHGPDLPPGPFCGSRGRIGGCCQDRQDRCSHRILDTLCYCDEFCNHTTNDDCCPDYEAVCLGLVTTPAPLPVIMGACILGKVKMERCNKCTCNIVDNQPDWVCELDPCLISDDLIRGVTADRAGWRAGNYSQLYNRKLKDGLTYRCGTLPLDAATKRMNAIQYDKDISYPRDFDARKQWPKYISPIVDQGWCGSDWAVSIASVASDRFAIQSNGAERVILSPQSLLSCNNRGQQGCEGGHIDKAWNYARINGLVDAECFPYTAKVSRCPYKPKGSLLDAGCKPHLRTRTSKYRVSVPYKLNKEKNIMWEIMESGPVLAVMKVYQDFFHYKDGVYTRSRHGDNQFRLHTVKIIGWGEERGQAYWLAANSWGEEWGENGYFRIARGTNEVDIESFVFSGYSDVNEAYQGK